MDDEQPAIRSRSRRASTRSPSPPPATSRNSRRKLLEGSGHRQTGAPQSAASPWAQQLKLEPKRVQVMQASFFGQTTSTPVQQRSDNPLHVEDERDHERILGTKDRQPQRRNVEPAFNQRSSTTKDSSTSQQAVPTPVLDPTPFRPYRTYARVPLPDSVTASTSSNQGLADSGLALGRSYRVGWGSDGELITLNGVYDLRRTKSDVLKVEKLKLLSSEDKTASLRLLELQLAHSEIYPSSHTDPSSSSPVPFIAPQSDLRFHHFSELFSDSDANAKNPELSNSPEAQFFKLAAHLFDEIPDLQLEYVSSSSAGTITALRRRDLLSTWLSTTLLPSVSTSLHNPSLSPLSKIFLLLTAHQLSQACDLAISSSNLRLASLISQIGTISSSSTDIGFQLDLEKQLEKWKEYKVDSHVSIEVRKIYELLSGNLGLSAGTNQNSGVKEDQSQEFHVLEGCEWKAAFAMGLWYARNNGGETSSPGQSDGGMEDEVARAMSIYESSFKSKPDKVQPPLPSHATNLEDAVKSATTTKNPVTPTTPLDPIYHLLKLFTSSTHSLEHALSPQNFGTCSTDYRLPWHLYLMFSRVLRRRDFEDRLQVDTGLDRDEDNGMTGGEEGEETGGEGNSVRADQMTVSYAQQLESLGMWEWSVFVLLHLELEIPRAQAVQQLLTRHVSSFTPSLSAFLIETLKVPPFYLHRARAVHAQALGDIFGTYKYLLSAEESAKAHAIATEELCPEAIVRGDSNLVKRLLEPFRQETDDSEAEDKDEDEDEEDGEFRGTVAGWESGGKIYLQYLHTLNLFSRPKSSSLSATSSSQAYLCSTIQSVQEYTTRVNSTPKLSKNKKLRMALSEMSSRLNVLSRALGGRALTVTQPSLLGESEKLVWLQGATQSFLQSRLSSHRPPPTATINGLKV